MAHYLGMNPLIINCVTDDSDPDTMGEINLDEVIKVATGESDKLYQLLYGLIEVTKDGC